MGLWQHRQKRLSQMSLVMTRQHMGNSAAPLLCPLAAPACVLREVGQDWRDATCKHIADSLLLITLFVLWNWGEKAGLSGSFSALKHHPDSYTLQGAALGKLSGSQLRLETWEKKPRNENLNQWMTEAQLLCKAVCIKTLSLPMLPLKGHRKIWDHKR